MTYFIGYSIENPVEACGYLKVKHEMTGRLEYIILSAYKVAFLQRWRFNSVIFQRRVFLFLTGCLCHSVVFYTVLSFSQCCLLHSVVFYTVLSFTQCCLLQWYYTTLLSFYFVVACFQSCLFTLLYSFNS